MRTSLAGCALAGAAVVAALAFMYSGFADVAATSPPWSLTRWVLSTTMERSVERHAKGIEAPASLDDPERVREGAEAYDAMCASCHGAPGVEPGVVGKGLEPEPPRLAEVAADLSAAEIFWVTANGVRMTGMPAFARTHSGEELWDVVAAVKALPRMSGADYRALVPAHLEREHHGHHHDS